jgi:hypothetical protein
MQVDTRIHVGDKEEMKESTHTTRNETGFSSAVAGVVDRWPLVSSFLCIAAIAQASAKGIALAVCLMLPARRGMFERLTIVADIVRPSM